MPIGAEQLLLSDAQFAFNLGPAPNIEDQEPADQTGEPQQPRHHHRRQQCLGSPRLERFTLADGDRGDQWQLLTFAEGVEAFDAIQAGGIRRGADRLIDQVLGVDRRFGEVAAHVLLAEGIAHQQRAVGIGQTDGTVLADVEFAEQAQKVFHAQRHGHNPGELAAIIIETAADGDHPLLIGTAADRWPDKGFAARIGAMMNEIGSINTAGTDRNRPVRRHQPMTISVIDGDTAHLWHQRLLAVDQRTQALDLRGATAFGFQAFDQPEQQQRTLPDNAFGIGLECLGQVQPVHVDFLQRAIARRQHFPDGQRRQGAADDQQQEDDEVGITLHEST
ncbi:hypothetical protein D3C81_1146110 [compost metagenome]